MAFPYRAGHQATMTPDRFKPLLDREFLKGELAYEFADYRAGAVDDGLRTRLANWATREVRRSSINRPTTNFGPPSGDRALDRA